MLSLDKIVSIWTALVVRLNSGGQWIPPFFLRLILFWEFWESGITKVESSNWFAGIHDEFPFPFDIIPVDLSWFLATWSELIFPILLLLGLFTRFSAIVLLILTAVAASAVHWPGDWSSLSELWNGYSISNKGFGNFKLPLLYTLMLFPLIFTGAGKLSIDFFLSKRLNNSNTDKVISDLMSKGLVMIVIGIPLFFVIPVVGSLSLICGIGLIIFNKVLENKQNIL